jgi:hypothetical protein
MIQFVYTKTTGDIMGKNTDLLGRAIEAVDYWADARGLSVEDMRELDSMIPTIIASGILHANGEMCSDDLVNETKKALLAAYQLGRNSI